MSSSSPYPASNEPPYPAQQQLNQYPPTGAFNYGAAYPPPSNAAYPPPVETVPPASNPAFPPPPSYDTAVGSGKPGSAPGPYGQNYSYQTQPIPPVAPATTYPPSYTADQSSDVEYGGYHDRIISFDDKTIRLGMYVYG